MIGKEMEHFRILEKLSEGGMGTVYKAMDTHLDVVRAIKLLKPALTRDQEFMTRFVREAKNLARLNHPNIVTVHGFYSQRSNPFIVMEYVEGPSLRDFLLNRGPLSYSQALPLFKQVLHGLAYAHRKGIVHRDIKPSNILMTQEREVKLADFGLAKYKEGNEETITVSTIGTLYYMSPEHVENMKQVDYRSDIYSVGMTFYEVLAGRTPFNRDDTAYLILKAIIEHSFEPPNAFYPGIPAELTAIIMQALAKKPDDRFQSSDEMLLALQDFETKRHSSSGSSTIPLIPGLRREEAFLPPLPELTPDKTTPAKPFSRKPVFKDSYEASPTPHAELTLENPTPGKPSSRNPVFKGWYAV